MTMSPRDPTPDDSAREWHFDELLAEGMGLVRAYAPEWTDHNPSDPGITLVELFAYVTEILLYRAGRISPDAFYAFLRLLDPQAAVPALVGGPLEDLDQALDQTMLGLASTEFAATTADFERHACRVAMERLGPHAPVRALCVAGVDLQPGPNGVRSQVAPSDFSVVIAPQRELASQDMDHLLMAVQRDLAARCLLTSRVHVIGPVVLTLQIGCRITLEPLARLDAVVRDIQARLRQRFGPAMDEEWPTEPRPFGRPLHLSEIVVAIDSTAGVDHVEEVQFLHAHADEPDHSRQAMPVGLRIGVASRVGDDARLGGLISLPRRRFQQDATGEIEVVHLQPWELVRVLLEPAAVTLVEEAVVDAAKEETPADEDKPADAQPGEPR